MRSQQREIHGLLKAAGAKILRRGNHEVWQLPSGRRLTVSMTPSDRRALLNIRASLRRELHKK